MFKPTRARIAAAESAIRRPVGGVFGIGWVFWEGINKLGEHMLLSWICERLRDQEALVDVLKWTVGHPFWCLVTLAVVYLAIVSLKAMFGSDATEETPLETGTSGESETIIQKVHDLHVNGPVRVVGKVAGDYIEQQHTHIHAVPLSEAQLSEFQQIDKFVVKKDELGLRETFDFPGILKYNIILARLAVAPRTVSQSDARECNEFFEGGKAFLDFRYRNVRTENFRLHQDPMPGKIGLLNGSKRYHEARELLMTMYSSSTLPVGVAMALKELDKTIGDNLSLMIESLNDSYETNKRNLLENDDPTSDRYGSAAGRYWYSFVSLKPKAEVVSDAIRQCLRDAE
jgi:hypothetical protein